MRIESISVTQFQTRVSLPLECRTETKQSRSWFSTILSTLFRKGKCKELFISSYCTVLVISGLVTHMLISVHIFIYSYIESPETAYEQFSSCRGIDQVPYQPATDTTPLEVTHPLPPSPPLHHPLYSAPHSLHSPSSGDPTWPPRTQSQSQ